MPAILGWPARNSYKLLSQFNTVITGKFPIVLKSYKCCETKLSTVKVEMNKIRIQRDNPERHLVDVKQQYNELKASSTDNKLANIQAAQAFMC